MLAFDGETIPLFVLGNGRVPNVDDMDVVTGNGAWIRAGGEPSEEVTDGARCCWLCCAACSMPLEGGLVIDARALASLRRSTVRNSPLRLIVTFF